MKLKPNVIKTNLEQAISTAYTSGLVSRGVKTHISSNLNPRFRLRPYQVEALERFAYYNSQHEDQSKPIQLLFHMATGSGKTLIMASVMLDLYVRGYRNFIFFVHSKSIIEKTRDNFLNLSSSKYLFADTIKLGGRKINIKEVDNFEAVNDNDIHIVFTTIQGLHAQLNTPRENSLTYEDFEDKKMVLLSDEAHHINAETKKSKPNKIEKEAMLSWENTVNKIFYAHPDNYLLEFTATADLSHPEVYAKYQDKLIFDYALKQFRQDKYSKEVKVLQTDLPPFDRALQAVIISQYRQKIFDNYQLHIKPVILFKSKTIKESQAFYKEFVSGIQNLSEEKIRHIQESVSHELIKKVFQYFKKNKISLENLILELKNDFSEDKSIIVNSKSDTEEKQLIINSLEDSENLYRAIFAVDKLNEGWDVLNLFDIVRLYDTQSSAKAAQHKVSNTTMSEAQLIGRGARYYPFQIYPEQPLFQRKYDDDISHDLRIGEELYYHAAHNPSYISELNRALQHIGIKAAKSENKLKKPESSLLKIKTEKNVAAKKYNKENDDMLSSIFKHKIYKKKFAAANTTVQLLIGETLEESIEQKATKIYSWDSFSTSLVRKALNKLPFYRFDNLQQFFPQLNSITQFIKDDAYLNSIRIEFVGTKTQVMHPSNEMKLEAVMDVLDKISQQLLQE